MAKKKDASPEFNPDDYPDYDPEDYGYSSHQDPLLASMLGNNMDVASFWQEPDFLLADIIHVLVNIAELEIGITLFVKGMTLTGVLTSERSYLKDLSDTFRKRVQLKNQKMSKEEREALNQMFDFTRLAESTLAQELDEEGVEMPDGMSSIRFLHLKNPILVGQGGVMDFGHNDTPYIRLRLSLIDGWMLGEVVTPEMFHDNDDSGEILH